MDDRSLSLLALVSSTLLFATEGIPLRMPMAGISFRPLESGPPLRESTREFDPPGGGIHE